ncbi:hypothetical protein D3C84_405790 [compost metagenome]
MRLAVQAVRGGFFGVLGLVGRVGNHRSSAQHFVHHSSLGQTHEVHGANIGWLFLHGIQIFGNEPGGLNINRGWRRVDHINGHGLLRQGDGERFTQRAVSDQLPRDGIGADLRHGTTEAVALLFIADGLHAGRRGKPFEIARYRSDTFLGVHLRAAGFRLALAVGDRAATWTRGLDQTLIYRLN